MLKTINTALAFILELFGVLALAWWGINFFAGKLPKAVGAVLPPLAMILVWYFFCAPASPHRFLGLKLVVLKLFIFALVTAALAGCKQPAVAGVFATLVIINLIVSFYFGTL